MIMVAVICVVITSFVWVVVIYHVRKKMRPAPRGPGGPGGRKEPPPPLALGPDKPYMVDVASQEQIIKEQTSALLPTFNGHLPTSQDSGSEHSSGKDSGVNVQNKS